MSTNFCRHLFVFLFSTIFVFWKILRKEGICSNTVSQKRFFSHSHLCSKSAQHLGRRIFSMDQSNVLHMHQAHCAFAGKLPYSFKWLSKPTLGLLLTFYQNAIILLVPGHHHLISNTLFIFTFLVPRFFFCIKTNTHFKRHCSFIPRNFFTCSEKTEKNPVMTTNL